MQQCWHLSVLRCLLIDSMNYTLLIGKKSTLLFLSSLDHVLRATTIGNIRENKYYVLSMRLAMYHKPNVCQKHYHTH